MWQLPRGILDAHQQQRPRRVWLTQPVGRDFTLASTARYARRWDDRARHWPERKRAEMLMLNSPRFPRALAVTTLGAGQREAHTQGLTAKGDSLPAVKF